MIRGLDLARLPSAGKTIAIVVALLLALGATIAIFLYVRGVEQRAFEDAELVEVLVAQGPIETGTTGEGATEAGLIARESAPRVNVPPGAVTSVDQIEGLVALESILTGEIILRERWGTTAEVSVGLDIPEGFEAVAVEVAVPPGVAGYVAAGTQVSILATIESEADDTVAPAEPDEEGAVPEEEAVPLEVRTQYLLQGVDVLAVGQRQVQTDEQEGTVSSVLMTLAVQPEDAERLVFAVANGSLYFTLLPEDAEPVETPGRTFGDLFDGLFE
jgi:pilus assembly protein CpaB